MGTLRQTIRSLLRAPVFTLVAIGALSLGIGASAALFSVIDGVLLRPLGYREPDRLVVVYSKSADGQVGSLSYPQFLDWRQQSTAFEAMSFAYGDGFLVKNREGAERILAGEMTEGFFRLMGTPPLLGRLPSAEEERAGGERVIVLSYELWRGRFGGDRGVIGRPIDTDKGSFTVIGVMPDQFRYPEWAHAWVPVGPLLAQTSALSKRDWHADIRVLARLKPGVTVERATNELDQIARRLAVAYPKEDFGLTSDLTPLPDSITADVRPALLLLAGAVGTLLLIACANVANLSLVRGSMRARELAVRAALGADRWRIVRDLIAESVVLAAAAGIVGLGLAWWAVHALRGAAPAELPRVNELGLDWRVVAFICALAVLTPIVFGLVPALHAARPNLSDAMKQGSRGSGSGRRDARVRSAFIIAQVTLCLVLLVAAGLLARSFVAISGTSPGFSPEHLVTFRVGPDEKRYDTPEKLRALYDRLRDEIARLPGAKRVGVINHLPMTGTGVYTIVKPEGQQFDPGKEPQAMFRVTDDHYFATIGQPLLRGRVFGASDMMASSTAAVITARLAAQLWPSQNPIGRRITVFKQAVGRPDYNQPVVAEVVGVVGDVKMRQVTDSAVAEVYLPLPVNPWRSAFVTARAAGDPAAFITAMRRAVAAIDPDIPLNGISTVTSIISLRLVTRRFNLVLIAAFSAVALALATVGIYGVIAYGLTQRRHEIGVRTALGAPHTTLLALFVRQGVVLALAGVAIGVPLALVATRWLESMVYGVGARDAATFGVVAIVMVIVAGVASYLPARRLTRVDPVEALRGE